MIFGATACPATHMDAAIANTVWQRIVNAPTRLLSIMAAIFINWRGWICVRGVPCTIKMLLKRSHRAAGEAALGANVHFHDLPRSQFALARRFTAQKFVEVWKQTENGPTYARTSPFPTAVPIRISR